MKDPYKRRRENHVLFLDEGFDQPEAYDRLKEVGFLVERFCEHFKGKDGKKLHNVKDPAVISHCNTHGWLLISTDASIFNLHRKELAAAKFVGVLATAHNSPDNLSEWVEGLIKLKPKIEQNNFKKRQRPWFAQFNRQGKITVGPILVTWPGTLTAKAVAS